MRRKLFALVLCLAGTTQAATITSAEIARPEGPRHYLMATPAQMAAGKRPLVIVLHGHTGSANLVFGKERLNDPMQQWLEIADREQLLVIAPDGMKGGDDKRGWNDCRADASTNPKSDDVGLIGALIDKAVADNNADPDRVYVIGMSNGGIMTFRLGVELAPRLAAIATVAALWPAKSLCPAPIHPLPLLMVHGTADKVVPYAGGEVGHMLLKGRGTTLSADQTLALWRKPLHLSDAATKEESLPHQRESGDTSVRHFVWGQDQLEFYQVERGGHSEPSIHHRMGWIAGALLGAQNADFEVAGEAWRFFRDKRRQ